MACEFLIGRFANGFVVRVVGRGTMQESPAFRSAVSRALESGVVVFDATRCEYLDSTFLGCLIGLKKSCEQFPERRFLIAAGPAIRIKLFCTSSLDKYFDFVEVCPETEGQPMTIDVESQERDVLGRHMMRCHATLAEMGGREAPAFKAIADRLAKELGDRASVE
jgi:anti-anti-sigma regulatory factor